MPSAGVEPKTPAPSRIRVRSYEPTLEWDVREGDHWVGTVLAPCTGETTGARDALALRRAREKFAVRPATINVSPRIAEPSR